MLRSIRVPSLRVASLLALIPALSLGLPAATALPTSGLEKLPTPKSLLWQEPTVLEVTVLSVEVKRGPHAGSSVWHRVRVDRIERGEGLEPGDEAAVVSRVYDTSLGGAGTSGHRADFRGSGAVKGSNVVKVPNGLPVPGDRARLFASNVAQPFQPNFTNGWQPLEPVLAFVAADDEYRSEVTMPFLAGLVAKPLGASASIHLATDAGPYGGPSETPKPDAKTHLTGSTTLSRADLIVAYLRFERLDASTLDDFLDPLELGIPLVAFRTSTHAFAYPETSPNATLNDGFGERFLGTPWRFHHGHASRTRILPPDAKAAQHPILAGVAIPAEGIVVPSWLYHVEPLPPDCTVLLWGEAIDSERKDAPARQPILWTRERPVDRLGWRDPKAPAVATPRPQRVAVTTLGHPGDFANPEFRLIAAQMVGWAASRDRELDDAERAAIRAAPFDPPPTR